MDGGRIGNNVEKYGKREDGAEKKEEVEKEIDGEIERKKKQPGSDRGLFVGVLVAVVWRGLERRSGLCHWVFA